jgi:hypothetical protein
MSWPLMHRGRLPVRDNRCHGLTNQNKSRIIIHGAAEVGVPERRNSYNDERCTAHAPYDAVFCCQIIYAGGDVVHVQGASLKTTLTFSLVIVGFLTVRLLHQLLQ